MNIDFPASVLIYPGGAGIVEVFYRLLLDPLLLGLVSHVLLKGRGQRPIFWALAFLTSLIEPLTQGLGSLALGLPLILTVLGLDFGRNLAQAIRFSKYGFLAAIVMRIAFYAVWHGVYAH